MCLWSNYLIEAYMMHICVSKLTIIGSDNGLSPGRHQAIIWNHAVTLLIGPLGTNLSEICIGIQIFSFTEMHFKMSSGKRQPFVSASMCYFSDSNDDSGSCTTSNIIVVWVGHHAVIHTIAGFQITTARVSPHHLNIIMANMISVWKMELSMMIATSAFR